MKIKLKNMLAVFLILPALAFADEKGRQIMEKNDALKEPDTRKGVSVMVVMKGDSKELKEFEMVSKKYGKKTRSRSTFLKPTRIEFLSWSEPGEDSLQWIKLSGGTVRKIASSDKGGSFVGSHFYYEDMQDRDIDDFNYKYLGDEKVNGEDCFKVESVKKKGTKVYVKTIVYIRKSDYFMIKADFYENKGHTKILEVDKIETIDGILTARKITMSRTDGKGKSIIYIKEVDYNKSVSDEFLKKESL
ncbi:MAG: outer membrane lipoprotein-sorting protein [Spirochaetia bacterium]|nr:outer membrane lipoprotein-sorting protein [Spirochaetia bacterium]